MDALSILAVVLALASLVLIIAFWRWWGRAKWVYFFVVAILTLSLYLHVRSLHL